MFETPEREKLVRNRVSRVIQLALAPNYGKRGIESRQLRFLCAYEDEHAMPLVRQVVDAQRESVVDRRGAFSQLEPHGLLVGLNLPSCSL